LKKKQQQKNPNKLRIIFFLESQFRPGFLHVHSKREGAGT